MVERSSSSCCNVPGDIASTGPFSPLRRLFDASPVVGSRNSFSTSSRRSTTNTLLRAAGEIAVWSLLSAMPVHESSPERLEDLEHALPLLVGGVEQVVDDDWHGLGSALPCRTCGSETYRGESIE